MNTSFEPMRKFSAAGSIGVLFLLASFLFSAFYVPAITGELYGTVTDAANGEVLPGVNVQLQGSTIGATTDINGRYRLLGIVPGTYTVQFRFIGFQSKDVKNIKIQKDGKLKLDVSMNAETVQAEEIVVSGRSLKDYQATGQHYAPAVQMYNTEDYAHIQENVWQSPRSKPLSTFSIDVDAGSYSNIRRFIEDGELPPGDAVRIEEMINYFTYEYPEPAGEEPFSVVTDAGPAPWAKGHRLVQIGIQGKRIPETERPAGNLVFLLDVSGSMDSPDKLPLLKQAFTLLVDELRPQDRVAIVVYAGAAGLVLPSTPGDRKEVIRDAIASLEPGGSTAGAAGIRLAYQIAAENHLENGNNRVILATDGDFNVGTSSDAELIRLIEEKRDQGTYLTVLGFGTGNLKDNKMEQIADHGNGNYYYIDSRLEAEKVLVKEMGSTLLTIAKDVKIQVEFNPAKVAAYRLVGYENRVLADEDFEDDTRDAGELGAGHSVTALYEIVPAGVDSEVLRSIPDLRYQKDRELTGTSKSNELLSVKLRYKQPSESKSRLIERIVTDESSTKSSTDFLFVSSVASFGMILRDSEHKGSATLDQVLALAREGIGADEVGYRAGFIRLVEQYRELTGGKESQADAR